MRSRRTRVVCRRLMLAERRDLRMFFAGLTTEQWQQDTLCAGWTVQDVAAHLLAWDDLLLYRSRSEHLRALIAFTRMYAASLGSMTRLNRRIASRLGKLTTEEIVRRFGADDSRTLKWLFDGTNPGAHLAEYVIHDLDMRQTLGSTTQVPEERLVGALNGVTMLPGVRWGARRQLRSRRWEATDVTWSGGRGPVLRVPAETTLMALAGRSDAVGALALSES